MLKGRAIGGPLEGVKLSAPEGWDGLVKNGDGRFDKYHNGYYLWSVVRQTWVWCRTECSLDWSTRHYASRQL